MPQPKTTIELVQEAALRGWRFTPAIIRVKNVPKWSEYDLYEIKFGPYPDLLLKLYLTLFIWKVLGSERAGIKLMKYLASVNLHFREEIAKYAGDPMWFIEEQLFLRHGLKE